MREKFREFYNPTKEEINNFWKNALFSFDANVLLNLYRYSENTRYDIISKLEFLSKENRLWLPYQAVFEYQNNRLNAIVTMQRSYDYLQNDLEKKMKDIDSELDKYKRHPYLNTEEIKQNLKKKYEDIKLGITVLKERHPDFLDYDPVFEKLTEIFENCVGDSFLKEQLIVIYKEGQGRYENKVPPGYMDKSEKEKNGEQSLYGDLIIWKELIARFKDNDDNLIFITDDLKEDWWYIFNGKTVRPRRELIKEFLEETGKVLLIYKPEQFLQYAKSNLAQEVKQQTIEEVEEIRKFDEDILKAKKILATRAIHKNDPNLFYRFFDQIKNQIIQLSKEKFRDLAPEAVSDGVNILNLLRDDLAKYTRQLFAGQITFEQFKILLLGNSDLVKMGALSQAGLSPNATEVFKQKVFDIISSTMLSFLNEL